MSNHLASLSWISNFSNADRSALWFLHRMKRFQKRWWRKAFNAKVTASVSFSNVLCIYFIFVWLMLAWCTETGFISSFLCINVAVKVYFDAFLCTQQVFSAPGKALLRAYSWTSWGHKRNSWHHQSTKILVPLSLVPEVERLYMKNVVRIFCWEKKAWEKTESLFWLWQT